MISCRDAEHLFGRYLDGELSPSLQTELHAHRLQCIDCQNELALLEACGDVVALDRREPTVSASFTDRVLLARRAQARPVRRSWSRTFVLFGSPMAAAACVAMMFSVVRPLQPPHGVVRNARVAAPKEIQTILTKGASAGRSLDAMKELDSTPTMPTEGFLEALLAPVVERSRNTADGARRGAEDLLMLLHENISTTNEQLVSLWRSNHPESVSEQIGPPVPGEAVSPDSETASPTGDPVRAAY